MAASSISQGVFGSLPPGFSLSKLRRRKKHTQEDEVKEVWEKSFKNIWSIVEKSLKEMNENVFGKVVDEVIKGVVEMETNRSSGTLPCPLLLTGTNLPDHNLLLEALYRGLSATVTPHVVTLWSRDCGTVKMAVQCLVQHLVEGVLTYQDSDEDSEFEDEEEIRPRKKKRMQVSQLSMSTLAAWYLEKADGERKPVVLVIPDFESFTASVLGDLLSILCGYTDKIPFIIIFGVATSPAAVYQGLPRNVLAQLVVKLFHSEPSPILLNHAFEKILLSDKCPFRLGSKTMTFLTDVFLFHSFSVQRFVQGLKFCMLEHFYENNHFALCCEKDEVDRVLSQLPDIALEGIRKLPSFQLYVEKCDLQERKKLLLNDKYTKETVGQLMKNLHTHISNFHVALKCLHILARDLPGSPLGRHVRELYCKVVSNSIRGTPGYKQVMFLIGMQARTELETKIAAILDILSANSIFDILTEETNHFEPVTQKLENLRKELPKVGTSDSTFSFEQVRKQLVDVIEKELIAVFLVPPTNIPLHEILYFDDLVGVRRRISGAPRSAIHNALNNPHLYLECDCCELPDPDAVLPTLPDVAIAYKLYLECNKTINLVDWLQSFAAILKPDADDENGGVDQEVQARFTKAVSELQFLGYIKPSKAKSEHVTRLTFGRE